MPAPLPSKPVPQPLSILLAGSSAYTLQLAKVLRADSRFRISGVLTPAPQPVGRQKVLTPSSVHSWAEAAKIPVITILEKIDLNVKNSILDHIKDSSCDILVVVDFGYFVPNWLLNVPRIGPVNVHPSLLPRWRGSSPGQRVLLAGETTSAVSVIQMSAELDAGDLIAQLPFQVDPTWNSQNYYEFAFNLLAPEFGNILVDFATCVLKPVPQPVDSPTPMAGRLNKSDSYVPWDWITAACGWTEPSPQHAHEPAQASQAAPSGPQAPETGLLQDLASDLSLVKKAALFARASRAFSPWPKLWTLLPTPKGWQRLIIWHTSYSAQTQKLTLEQVQLEGKQPSTWNEIKNNWKRD